MPKTHGDRTLIVTCSFVHPSKQSTKTYKSAKYIYDFNNDGLSQSIVAHAKRKYASDNNIRSGWIGFITTNTQASNKKADSSLSEHVFLRG